MSMFLYRRIKYRDEFIMNIPTVLKLILMLSLTLLLFSAFSEDDAPTGPGANKLVGIWKLDKSTTFYGSLTDPDSSNVDDLGSDFSFTLTIKDDNTWTIDFIYLGDAKSSSGTWSVSGNKITIKVPGEPDETSEYSISGNKLTTTSGETIEGYTIFDVSEFTRQ